MKCCPACGQTLPPDVPEEFADLELSPQQFTLLRAVLKAGKWGILSSALIDRMYVERSDGGPISAVKVLHVLIWRINKKLKAKGKAIRGTRGNRGGTGVYTLRDLP